MSDAYRRASRAFAVVIAGFGVAIVALTLTRGGGPLSFGFLVGLAFVAMGAGRLYLASRVER